MQIEVNIDKPQESTGRRKMPWLKDHCRKATLLLTSDLTLSLIGNLNYASHG